MQIKGVGTRTWLEVTREEREFCAILFQLIKENPQKFATFLNRCVTPLGRRSCDLLEDQNWEVGFEVALYRDIEFCGGPSATPHADCKFYVNRSSERRAMLARKFDLALMRDDYFVVIEAKAEGFFKKEDVSKLEDDRLCIPRCFGSEDAKVLVIGICSSKYNPRFAKEQATKFSKGFDGFVTWSELAAHYLNGRDVFLRADDVHTPQKTT